MDMDQELTAGEAAAVLGVNRQRINQLARAGRIGRQVAGRYWVFTRVELESFKAQPKPKGGRPKENGLAPTLSVPTTRPNVVDY